VVSGDDARAEAEPTLHEAITHLVEVIEQVYSGDSEGLVGTRSLRRILDDHPQASRTPVVADAWDLRGGSMWLDRDQWGVIIDALIKERAHAEARGTAASDVRAAMCVDLLERIDTEASPAPVVADVDAIARVLGEHGLTSRALTRHDLRAACTCDLIYSKDWTARDHLAHQAEQVAALAREGALRAGVERTAHNYCDEPDDLQPEDGWRVIRDLRALLAENG
jgi:hypothetical protein